MSLSDNEYQNALAFLEQALNDSGLSWITTQVEEEIRFGKMTTRRVSARPDAPEDLALPGLSDARRRRVQIPATREYTAREKLEILCRAIEQAIVATADMQIALRSRLNRMDNAWVGVRLVRSDMGDRPDVEISASGDAQQEERVRQLHGLLNTLKEMM